MTAERKAVLVAAALVALLGTRGLLAAWDVGREAASIRPARVRAALATPLDRRLESEMALPSGSLGSLPADTIGWRVLELARRRTEPDAGIYLLLPGGHAAFRLYLRLSALLDPRVVVWINDSDERWVPTYDHPGSGEYVLDLAASGDAAWKELADRIDVAPEYELWRMRE